MTVSAFVIRMSSSKVALERSADEIRKMNVVISNEALDEVTKDACLLGHLSMLRMYLFICASHLAKVFEEKENRATIGVELAEEIYQGNEKIKLTLDLIDLRTYRIALNPFPQELNDELEVLHKSVVEHATEIMEEAKPKVESLLASMKKAI